jgi:transcriptional repressor NrdR
MTRRTHCWGLLVKKSREKLVGKLWLKKLAPTQALVSYYLYGPKILGLSSKPMKCPFCGYDDQKVLDSRPAREGEAIRRRRECIGCGRRFTTFEQPEMPRLFVVKRDGAREEFSREKTLNSMLIACGKRPVPFETVRDAAERIERDLFRECEEEVPSTAIGERVMSELLEIDQVAYVRFASVYKKFESVRDFREIVDACSPVQNTAGKLDVVAAVAVQPQRKVENED